jgi:hypothetical protein
MLHTEALFGLIAIAVALLVLQRIKTPRPESEISLA